MQQVAPPPCKCDLDSVEKTVTKDSANKGKRFFTCSKGMNDGCGFFEWSPNVGVLSAGAKSIARKKPKKVRVLFFF